MNMTVHTMLGILCRYINGMGYKAIQGPSNNPAPKGMHIAVVAGNVRQHGDRIVPGPVSKADQHKFVAHQMVATINFYEVEGDGEALRAIHNALQSDDFDTYVMSQAPENENGLDTGFSLWELGDVVDNSFQDGSYFIQQKTMTADFQFIDFIWHDAPRMMSVSGHLNEEPFHAEVTNG